MADKNYRPKGGARVWVLGNAPGTVINLFGVADTGARINCPVSHGSVTRFVCIVPTAWLTPRVDPYID